MLELAKSKNAVIKITGACTLSQEPYPYYEQGVEPFLKTDRLSDTERAMLMDGACAKAYGWSSKKAQCQIPLPSASDYNRKREETSGWFHIEGLLSRAAA